MSFGFSVYFTKDQGDFHTMHGHNTHTKVVVILTWSWTICTVTDAWNLVSAWLMPSETVGVVSDPARTLLHGSLLQRSTLVLVLQNLLLWSDSSCCVNLGNKRPVFYCQTQFYIIQITSYTFWLVTKPLSGFMWESERWNQQLKMEELFLIVGHFRTECLVCGKTVTQKLFYVYLYNSK